MPHSPSLPAITTAAITLVAALLLPSSAQGQQRRRDPGWPCKGTVDPAYVSMAEETGGMVMLVKPTELVGSLAESRASDRHGEVVFRAGGQFAEGIYEFDIPLDSTIASAYFFLSMQCLQSVSVIRPSGEELAYDTAGVEYHQFEALRLLTVPEPVPGTWKVRIAGRGYLSVVVKAATDLRLTDVAFAPGGYPLKREAQQLGVTMSGVASDIEFRLISASGATIEPLTLRLEAEDDNERRYAGDVAAPRAAFRVAVSGTDARGFRFQRVEERLNAAER